MSALQRSRSLERSSSAHMASAGLQRQGSGALAPLLRVHWPAAAAKAHAAKAPPRAAAKGGAPGPQREPEAANGGAPRARRFLLSIAVVLSAAAVFVASGAGEASGLLPARIHSAELPAARPPAWDYCDYSCARALSLETRPSGALVATVAHKPLAGVTASQLRWWFNGNVEGEMTHPVDGKTYSRYLVWHPRDHIEQRTLSPGAPGDLSGAKWLIDEFFLSAKPSGWLRGDDEAEWAGQLYTKVVLTVQKLSESGLSLAFELPGLGIQPVSLTHEWADSPEGALVVSTMNIGLADASGPGAALVSAGAKRVFACGGDAAQAARDWQLHALEEFGNFKFFLPQLYAAAS
ncbi:MAG: hypothetical protein J3K34DRAFT_403561 [Monoraphidium minutum]|nr:MAG: hypothetical protein J3K34DRAFT_403561 [Monoraphidium minutum]